MAESGCHINSLPEKSDTLFGELSCKIRQKQQQQQKKIGTPWRRLTLGLGQRKYKISLDPLVTKSTERLKGYWSYVKGHRPQIEYMSVLGQFYHQNKR